MKIYSALELLKSLRQHTDNENYWERYTELLCALARADCCLLIQQDEDNSFKVHGKDLEPDDWMMQQAEKMLADHQHQLERPEGVSTFQCSDTQGQMRLITAVRLSSNPVLTAVFDIPAREKSQLNELLLRLRLVGDLAAGPQAGDVSVLPEKIQPNCALSYDKLLDTLELMADVMTESHFGAASLTLVNSLASYLGSAQVVLGWYDRSYIKVAAISHVGRFNIKTEQTRLVENACEEAFYLERTLVYPVSENSGDTLLAHRKLHQSLGQSRIHSISLRNGSRQCQAVLLIVEQDVPVDESALQAIETSLGLLMPWLTERYSHDRWWGAKLYDWNSSQLGRLLGPEHAWQKTASLITAAALLYVCVASLAFRLEAGAVMVTDHTRLISAPFDGYIDRAFSGSGDEVESGKILARLDMKELFLKEAEIRAQMRSIKADADKAYAGNNLSDVEIARARLAQAQARLEQILQQRNQAEIKAPFSGVIVEGEQKDLLGAPVRKGDHLFRIARIEDLYGQLELNERLIRFLEPDAEGELVLLAQPDKRIPFKVTGIVPMAQVKGQQGNHFIVKVVFTQKPEKWWRPGMSGVARIDAGRRPIIWLWTYRFFDTLRMRLWL